MKILQMIIDGLATVCQTVVHLLPSSPFESFIDVSIDNDILSALNWVLPIGQMIAVLQAWLVSIAIWYLIQIILRWVKAIE